MQQARDIIIQTGNPEALDSTLQQLPGVCAVVVGGGMPGGYVQRDGGYLVRCFGNYGFLTFAVERQGYGKIIKEFDGLFDDDDGSNKALQRSEGGAGAGETASSSLAPLPLAR